MNQILIVEDDKHLNDGIRLALKKDFVCSQAYNIASAREMYHQQQYDLVLLDINLPDGDGIDFLTEIRKTDDIPVIMLTANNMEMDIVSALELGADDYITKPFKFGVLMSRINALLRRVKNFGGEETELSSNGIKVLLLKGQVFQNGNLLDLTAGEYKLLCLFMQNPGVVLPKEKILEKLWDSDNNYVDDNTLTVYIRRLRMKIEENPSEPQMILTVRRMGYKWNVLN